MRHWLAAVTLSMAALATGAAMPAQAGDQPVVVELFTSQGCASCPPADQLLGRLVAREDVIALALHVDYWDYIGWKDAFANPAFTKRQKGYARAAGSRTIYTPQLMVGGKDPVVGYRPMELADLIQAHRATPDTVAIDARREGDKIVIRAEMLSGSRVAMVVQLARFSPEDTVEITRGENAGLTIQYHNTVRDWRQIAEWDGTAPLNLAVEATEGPTAVIIQEAGFGPVRAAARLR
ncbi:thioredoxin family protein [Oceaniovalibus sp. ACAM 378]|uniref:DUF1223 domain-containing protein n=1 Tax=Oceaniovalibus sp. ACAM 378 TaxID=2599923 RepID=UPI0011D46778|nr:DUF1223 domain-containing protein [Oceaniovalibus sp. ACAM 378]TYB88092.1 DUF1223 domain-containing protein [Oceaniovalibus sp. ACAM 378]